MRYIIRYGIVTPLFVGVLFLVLKSYKLIDWSWVLVTVPFWVALPFTFVLSAMLILFLVLLMLNYPDRDEG